MEANRRSCDFRLPFRFRDARAFEKRIPSVNRPEPSSRYKWRIRFIRSADKEILDEWRASNDKKLWQKAVTILENRNLSPEKIDPQEQPHRGIIMMSGAL